FGHAPLELTPSVVNGIDEQGGTILGTSRGHQDPKDMVDTLERWGVNVLFPIGGDGTLRGACVIAQEAERRGKKIAVVVASATAITGGAVVVEQTIAPSPARASQAVAVVAAAAPTAATAAQWDVNAAGLEGPWVAEMGGGKLVILIHRENDKYAGIVYNGTRARGTLKLIKVSQEGNNVTIQSDNSVVRFDGKRATASTMTGTYYKFGKGSEVTLTREATTPLQPAPPTYKEVAVSPDKLDRFVGTYAANATRGMKITREGNNLQYDDLVYEKYTLYPKSETSFFSKDVDLVVEFASDANGNVTTVIWSEALSNTRWVMRKLNEQQLQRFRTALPRQQNPGAPK
ncbi:MAG TPA: 6-phosphofructokinase, partial [Candidatus Sumerlaeota bacterium]|nr:6-phosphofructokinase [Candidatus Sumerlaeota bacterium]